MLFPQDVILRRRGKEWDVVIKFLKKQIILLFSIFIITLFYANTLFAGGSPVEISWGLLIRFRKGLMVHLLEIHIDLNPARHGVRQLSAHGIF